MLYTSSGTYYHTLSSVYGCDSIIQLLLKVNPVYTTPISASICEGDSYNFWGTILTAAGTYIDTISSLKGCDSILVLTLTVNPVYSTPIAASVCKGDSYDFFGMLLTAAGTYSHVLSSVNGCDSIIELTLTLNPDFTTQIYETICDYGSYNFFGRILTEAGNYSHTLSTINGCDSVIYLQLTITTTEFSILPVGEICADASSFCVMVDLIGTEMAYYDVHFNSFAQDQKFEDFSSSILGKNCLEIKIPNNPTDKQDYVMPHYHNYAAYITVNDGKCFSDTIELQFQISYPSWIIEQKWNDVIALLDYGYNGGYTFSKYEWFKDGTENMNRIMGENGPYLYLFPKLEYGIDYRARITRTSDLETCFTCPIKPSYRPVMKVYPQIVHQNDPIYIETPQDGIVVVWDLLGRQLAQYPVSENHVNIIHVNATGFVLLQVIQNDGNRQTFKIIVN
jgi:hypothetical protein